MSNGKLQSCVIGICDGLNLLLPDNIIADVVSAIGIQAAENQDPWFMGETEWRGSSIPVISIEQLMRGGPARIRGSHIAVFYGTQDTARLPFYGIPFQAAPHSYPVANESELVVREDSHTLDYCLEKVRVRGVSTVIPDIKSIEDRLLGN